MDKINIDIISKFSHLLATEIESDNFDSIIIDTIYNSKRKLTNDTIIDEMNILFNISVDTDKVQISLSKLKNNNKIEYVKNYLALTSETMDDLTSIICENADIQDKAIKGWLTNFETFISKRLSQEHHDAIEQTIIKYLNGFFLIHGADSFSLITGEKDYSSIDVKSYIEYSVSNMPELYKAQMSLFLDGIFSTDLNIYQKKYCIKQINKAVAYLSTVADDFIIDKVMENIRGITIYLDTPILYRLLNLQGEGRYFVITSLINYCKENQIELKVFQKTIDELKRRIQYDAMLIEKYPYPVNFAAIGYKCRTSDNYLSTFWKANMDTGISAKDFNYQYKFLVELIEGHQIVVDNEHYIENYNLEDQISNLYNKVTSFSAKDPEYQKSPNSIEHDAICLAIIEHLRIPNVATAFESKVVFLTSDWSLVRLQEYDSEYKDKPDLVILPSQLMQLFCMTHSNDKYYETFLGLFSSSKTTFGTNKLSNECIQKILGRIAYYCKNPQFAEQVLCNQLIQDKFNTMETEEQQSELIYETMFSEVDFITQELNKKTEELSIAEQNKYEKNNTIEDLISKLEMNEKTIEKKDEQLENSNKYQVYFTQNITKKAKRMTLLRMIIGYTLIIIPIICVIACILAFIPITSGLVKPIFDYISNSKTIQQDDNSNLTTINSIIAIVATLPLGSGYMLIKPGYNKLLNSKIEKYSNF